MSKVYFDVICAEPKCVDWSTDNDCLIVAEDYVELLKNEDDVPMSLETYEHLTTSRGKLILLPEAMSAEQKIESLRYIRDMAFDVQSTSHANVKMFDDADVCVLGFYEKYHWNGLMHHSSSYFVD